MSVIEWVMAVMVLVAYGAVIVWLLRLLVRSLSDLRRDGWPSWTDLRETVAALKSLPDLLADRADGWLMDMHQPAGEVLDPADWCHTCHDPWPCEGFMEAADRRYERGNPAPVSRLGDNP